MSIESTTVFKKVPDARYRNVGGEGIVVRQAAGEVLVLSEVGTRVLDMASAEMPVGAILTSLGEEYDVEAPALEHDVLAYLQDLLDAGIIEPVTADSGDRA